MLILLLLPLPMLLPLPLLQQHPHQAMLSHYHEQSASKNLLHPTYKLPATDIAKLEILEVCLGDHAVEQLKREDWNGEANFQRSVGLDF
jgi:hypothetical protein